MNENDDITVDIDGETFRGKIVPATRDAVAPHDTAVFRDGTERVVAEWIKLRCGGCGEEAHTPKPPDVKIESAARNPDGSYKGLCPRCAAI